MEAAVNNLYYSTTHLPQPQQHGVAPDAHTDWTRYSCCSTALKTQQPTASISPHNAHNPSTHNPNPNTTRSHNTHSSSSSNSSSSSISSSRSSGTGGGGHSAVQCACCQAASSELPQPPLQAASSELPNPPLPPPVVIEEAQLRDRLQFPAWPALAPAISPVSAAERSHHHHLDAGLTTPHRECPLHCSAYERLVLVSPATQQRIDNLVCVADRSVIGSVATMKRFVPSLVSNFFWHNSIHLRW